MNTQEYIQVSLTIDPFTQENAEILIAELDELPFESFDFQEPCLNCYVQKDIWTDLEVNMSNPIFTGSGVALITPMNSDLTVNYDVLEQLIEFHIANGTDAIIACGTTGEAATLSEEEHCNVLKFVAEKVNHRIPVIGGTGSNDTMTAIELSKSAEKSGVDALLCVTPYYTKTSQDGRIKHFTMIADSVNIPIILSIFPYNVLDWINISSKKIYTCG